MAVEEKLIWKIYAGAVGALTTLVAQTVVTKGWEKATGAAPPDPNDPETPVIQAIIWAAASGLGVAVAQITMNRFMHKRWTKAMGHKGPGKLKNKMDF